MTDSYVVQISNAVVSSLNAASQDAVLNQTFIAQRAEVVISEMSDLEILQVSVIPGQLQAGAWDLSKRLVFDWEVSVWVQQRTDLIPSQTDPLRLLVEQIITLFLGQQIGIDSGVARCIGADTRQLPTPGQLDVTRVFTTGIFFTFRKTQ